MKIMIMYNNNFVLGGCTVRTQFKRLLYIKCYSSLFIVFVFAVACNCLIHRSVSRVLCCSMTSSCLRDSLQQSTRNTQHALGPTQRAFAFLHEKTYTTAQTLLSLTLINLFHAMKPCLDCFSPAETTAGTRRGKMYCKENRLKCAGIKPPVKFAIFVNGKVFMSRTKLIRQLREDQTSSADSG